MNRIPWYIIIALFAYIVFLKACDKCPASTVTTVVKRDTVYRTDTQTITAYKPMPVLTIVDTVTAKIDTNAVVQDYLSKKIYDDRVASKYGVIIIHDTVNRNLIAGRSVTFDFKVPEITTTNAIQQRNQIYAGLTLGGSKDFISFGPSLFLKTKTDRLYFIGASYTTERSLYYNFGAAWKIHF